MTGLAQFVRAPGARVFLLIWGGQLISLVGSALTQFALGVWVYVRTGSPTQFALSVICAALPRILLAPLAGALADRSDRRRLLILSDLGAALVTLALLAAGDALAVWHVYAATALASAAGSFFHPAYTASVSRLLPAAHYGRAAGLVALAPSLAAIIAPAAAGLLFVRVGLPGILLLDLASFLVAVAVLLIVRFPIAPPEPGEALEEPLLRSAIAGWRWLARQPGLLGLLLVSAAGNFLGITTEVLLTPYVLSFGTAELLGWLVAVGGAGLLGGGLLLALWGGPRRLLLGIFGFEAVVCLATVAIGLTTAPAALALYVGGYFVAISLADGCATALWQRSVPDALQGRVFALREAIAIAALPLGLLITAPLAELVLEPRLQPGGAWAAGLGALIGVGPGRGLALVFVAAGLLNLAILLIGWASPQIRRLDEERRADGL